LTSFCVRVFFYAKYKQILVITIYVNFIYQYVDLSKIKFELLKESLIFKYLEKKIIEKKTP